MKLRNPMNSRVQTIHAHCCSRAPQGKHDKKFCGHNSQTIKGMMLLLMMCLMSLGFAGCDKAKEIADNTINKVKEDFKSAKDKITKASEGDSNKKDKKSNVPYQRPKSDANSPASKGAMTLDSFRKIATNRITDLNLEALAKDSKIAGSVDELNLYNAQITSKGFETLQKFPKLEKLNLQDVKATKGNMGLVGKLKSLKILNLTSCPIDDTDFAGIVGLSNLEEIHLTGTKITDDGFRCFKQMPKLAVMVMDRMGHLEGKGFKYVNRNSLRVIKANGSKIGYYAFQSIGGSESLEELWLNGARVTDKAMQGIGRCVNLRDIRLERNDLTNKGIGYLRNHQKLETVVLAGNSRLNNDALKYLTKSKNLKLVNVVGTQCSRSAEAEFLKYVPGCKMAF